MYQRRLTHGIAAWLLLLSTSALAAPAEAQKMVDRWVKGKALRGLTIGVSVVDAEDGRLLAQRNAAAVMNPASGTKLLTSAAALHTLPMHPKWETRVHGIVEGTKVSGPLRVVGEGDPKLLLAHLERIADGLSAKGITEVSQGLILHTGHFDAAGLPPAFAQKTTDAGYRPAIGALASNFGAARITVYPGRRVGSPVKVTIEGGSEAVSLISSAKTTKGKTQKLKIQSAQKPDGRSEFVISGSIGRGAKPFERRKRIHDPDRWTGLVLQSLLKKRGLTLGAPLEITREPLPDDAGPPLETIVSRSLPETLMDINTWSNNFMAEMLLKQMGCVKEAACTWERAVNRASDALRAMGLSKESFTFVNGSGLYKATLVSAQAMTSLLVKMRSDLTRGGSFEGSLAVSGKPGTLRSRLLSKALRSKVRAKTGTLDEVVSLSGYLPARRGRTLAFSVIVNGATPKRTGAIRRKIDQLVRKLARL